MPKQLGKADVTSHVAAKLKGTSAEGGQALNAVLESITEALKAGKSVTLTGFGTFEVRQIKERKVRAIRGPQAGKLIAVPAHKRVGFRSGTELSRAVEGK
jgi:DNA-binding protein HU-beta